MTALPEVRKAIYCTAHKTKHEQQSNNADVRNQQKTRLGQKADVRYKVQRSMLIRLSVNWCALFLLNPLLETPGQATPNQAARFDGSVVALSGSFFGLDLTLAQLSQNQTPHHSVSKLTTEAFVQESPVSSYILLVLLSKFKINLNFCRSSTYNQY